MKNTHLPLLLSLGLALGAAGAHAEKADRAKPMNVEADALRYDDLKQASVFTGRVVLTKGTIVIRGARVDVRQDAEGYQYGVVTAEPGKLAFYRQKRDGVDEYIEGEGETIEYDGKADRVKFVKRAELRRFRGATLADEMAGSLITYDNGNDVFTVDGGPASPAVGGRVRAVLAPKPGASAPAVQQAPGATLRPSTTMDGAKK
ncbi:MAG: lipopolysaccharide transport periplasmic protein LptA [Ramlibacter sp.]|nr:lipopolysaccharide transport periplasmic protein LptA [Ramlibacter sp.]